MPMINNKVYSDTMVNGHELYHSSYNIKEGIKAIASLKNIMPLEYMVAVYDTVKKTLIGKKIFTNPDTAIAYSEMCVA